MDSYYGTSTTDAVTSVSEGTKDEKAWLWTKLLLFILNSIMNYVKLITTTTYTSYVYSYVAYEVRNNFQICVLRDGARRGILSNLRRREAHFLNQRNTLVRNQEICNC